MRTAAILGLLFLTACSSSNQVYGLGVVPQNVTGDGDKVSVFNVWSAGDAQPLADRYCRERRKVASFDRMSGITANFTCVSL